MRHAAAGNLLMLKMATSGSHYSHSHTFAAHPAAVGMSGQNSPQRGCKGLLGRWPGPLLTVLDACECHSRTEGNTERIHRIRHTHTAWAEGVSANPQVHSRGNRAGRIPHGGILAL